MDGELPRSQRMAGVFQGALGKHRYTRLLADTDLGKVIYAYGTMDENLGRLTPAEVEFLTGNNAKVVEVEGGHTAMLKTPSAIEKISELLGM